MAAYAWPATLPQYVRPDFSEVGTLRVRRTPVDMGPAKIRYSGRLAEPLKVSWHMTDAQVATLKSFVYSTLQGVYRFDFTHPRTSATVEARFVPGSDGEYFSCAYFAPGWWIVSADLEVMP